VRRLAESPDAPITVVRIHYVKAGCESQFEAELKKHMATFTAIPANLGISIFRPGKYHDGVYRIVYKFASQKELDKWHASPTYLSWMATEKDLTIAPPRTELLSGLETWFTLPGQNVLKPPTKARQAVVTWIAALPVSIIISILTGPFLDSEPLVIQKAVFIALLVVLLTWVVMPLATRLFFRYLYPAETLSAGAD
jgi:antibiotic biosynthesis monooxygenase (ABM) superfamily enzyme